MLPWGQVIHTGMSIAEIAGKIFSANKKQQVKTEGNGSDNLAQLLKRIETLEKNELKQSELIQQMAQQNLILTKKSKHNYKLAVVAIGISVLAIALFLGSEFL